MSDFCNYHTDKETIQNPSSFNHIFSVSPLLPNSVYLYFVHCLHVDMWTVKLINKKNLPKWQTKSGSCVVSYCLALILFTCCIFF